MKITDMSFVADLEQALRLLEPILAILLSLEADRPLVSQCLPIWESLYKHIRNWHEVELFGLNTALDPALRIRFFWSLGQKFSCHSLCSKAGAEFACYFLCSRAELVTLGPSVP